MRKISLLLLFVSLFVLRNSSAQKTDSLIIVLKTAKEDTSKVKLLNNIAASLKYSDPLKAIDYAKKAAVLAKKTGHSKELSKAYSYLAAFNIMLGNHSEAEIHLYKADSICKKIDYTEGHALVNSQIAMLYFEKANYNEALKYRLKALHYYEKSNDKAGQAITLGNIGGIYGMLRQYDEARKYFNNALKIKIELGDKRGVSIMYINIATSYYDQQNWKPSIEYFEKALAVKEISGDIVILATCKANLGNLYSQTENFTKALNLHEECLVLYTQLSDTAGMAMTLKNIGDLKCRMGKYSEALDFCERSLALIQHTDNNDQLKAIYACLSDSYSGLNDHKNALLYYKKCIELERQIFTDETALKIAQQKEEYEAEKKENEIKFLKEKQVETEAKVKAEAETEKEKNKVWVTMGIASILILIMLVLMIIISGRQKRKQQITEFALQKAELEQNALRAQMNPHFIFNALNSIQHYILNNEAQYAYDYLAKFSKLIRLVLVNSQHNTINLKKELELLNIYLDLEQRRFKNRFEYEIKYDSELSVNEIKIPVMLIQPYVENSIWHGIMNLDENKKGRLTIELIQQEGIIKISIEDNGVGRKKAAEIKKNSEYESVGMLFTKKRVDILDTTGKSGAKINVIDLYDENGNASGTRVEIDLPFTE